MRLLPELFRLPGEYSFTNLNPVTPHPALLLQNNSQNTLVIGDLHIGWEASLAEQGLHIPSQTPKLLERLGKIVEETDSVHLIILGDVKHTVERVELMEWRDIPIFFETLLELVDEVSVIPGNHDGNLEALVPRNVNILPTSGFTVDSEVGIIHGHAWPKPEILGCTNIVMGHLHPIIRLTDALYISTTHQVWLRTDSDGEVFAKGLLKHLKIKVEDDVSSTMKRQFGVTLTNPRCIFLPSFNNLLSGQTINRGLEDSRSEGPYLGPLLKSGGVLLEDGDAYLLDGSYLGKLKSLQKFS